MDDPSVGTGPWEPTVRRTGGPDGTGASHDEVPSVLRQGRSFWRDQLFRAAGASHGEALALESEGVDAFSYRDLPQMGGDGGILDCWAPR